VKKCIRPQKARVTRKATEGGKESMIGKGERKHPRGRAKVSLHGWVNGKPLLSIRMGIRAELWRAQNQQTNYRGGEGPFANQEITKRGGSESTVVEKKKTGPRHLT